MKKVLFVNHDITPYVSETELSTMGRIVPQKVQEAGCEIRTFMPRWGNINERRGQLHEVIRLSGLNICINDTDHPLIIKVASIPSTKVQVYFIDNEEFFTRRGQIADQEGNTYTDNGERAVFFARGVIETIKKLRWTPDIIHCQGWMAALAPIYAKIAYKDEPSVANVKIVTSLIGSQENTPIEENIKDCIAFNDITVDSLSKYDTLADSNALLKMAIDNSDGIIITSDNIDPEILEYARQSNAKILEYQEEEIGQKYVEFYESL
ncbi:MAG: glycogen/starch synthase [Prevotella sp.]|nr:glycogen/starch synthase [Candidatus Prevotella equi]